MYADIEGTLKLWATATASIASQVTAGSRTNIYLAMPAASPLPALIIQRVGGGLVGTGDLPGDMARISFDCWGTSRPQALALSQALVTALDDLGPAGGWSLPGIRLETAEIALWLWQADTTTDAARYIVDARIWSVSA
jgi:hypothetical protein